MSGPVKVVPSEATPRVALAQVTPVVKPAVLQAKLATGVLIPEFKLEARKLTETEAV